MEIIGLVGLVGLLFDDPGFLGGRKQHQLLLPKLKGSEQEIMLPGELPILQRAKLLIQGLCVVRLLVMPFQLVGSDGVEIVDLQLAVGQLLPAAGGGHLLGGSLGGSRGDGVAVHKQHASRLAVGGNNRLRPGGGGLGRQGFQGGFLRGGGIFHPVEDGRGQDQGQQDRHPAQKQGAGKGALGFFRSMMCHNSTSFSAVTGGFVYAAPTYSSRHRPESFIAMDTLVPT